MGSQMRTILLTILFLASATGVFAQNADQGPTVQPSPGFQTNEKRGPRPQLNLTEDQKAKIKEIREADKDSLKSAIEQVRAAREALQSALLANPENAADIQAKATTLGNAQSALTRPKGSTRGQDQPSAYAGTENEPRHLQKGASTTSAPRSSKPRADTESRINQRCFWL
jgi:Spy/CpxP family protein refolding chaperone